MRFPRGLVVATGWTGGHPAVFRRFRFSLPFHAFTSCLVGICLAHALRLRVAFGHFALGLLWFRFQACVNEVLTILPLKLFLSCLRLAILHLCVLCVFGAD